LDIYIPRTSPSSPSYALPLSVSVSGHPRSLSRKPHLGHCFSRGVLSLKHDVDLWQCISTQIMAYSNSTNDRMDELRFRMSDSSLGGLVSPPRNNSRLPQPLPPQDGRGGMVRRFTTDSGRVPTIASLTTLRSGQESMDFGPSVCGSPLHLRGAARACSLPPVLRICFPARF
jgi:hypothetical protein